MTPLTDNHEKGRVALVGALAPYVTEPLREAYDCVAVPKALAHEALDLAGRDTVVAAVTSGFFGFSAELMAAFPALKAIAVFGVGYDKVDMAAARERGITVSNTPGVLDACVADTAIGLLIDVFRRFSAADRFVRAGAWTGGQYPLTSDFSGKRVGILGLGRIGRAIARRLAGFDITVSYHNRRRRDDVPYRYHTSALDLARDCDALVVAASGGPDSQGVVSREVLTALGKGFLVNIARASLVDQEAMIEMLRDGRLGGAGLDVYATEPDIPDELKQFDNVVLLPHVGAATIETRHAMAELTRANIVNYLAHGALLTPVE